MNRNTLFGAFPENLQDIAVFGLLVMNIAIPELQ